MSAGAHFFSLITHVLSQSCTPPTESLSIEGSLLSGTVPSEVGNLGRLGREIWPCYNAFSSPLTFSLVFLRRRPPHASNKRTNDAIPVTLNLDSASSIYGALPSEVGRLTSLGE